MHETYTSINTSIYMTLRLLDTHLLLHTHWFHEFIIAQLVDKYETELRQVNHLGLTVA